MAGDRTRDADEARGEVAQGRRPPALPESLPADLRDFIECRTASATIANGPVSWVQLPDGARGFLGREAKPELTITPGVAPGTGNLAVKVGFVSVTLPATVADGRLSIDTSKLPFWAPSSIAADVRAFVDDLNGWLAANGMGLAPPTFGPDGMTLAKVPAERTA